MANIKNGPRTVDYFMRLLKKVLGALLCASLTGCFGLHGLPNDEAAYFRQKIETALASHYCIKSMVVLKRDGKRSVVIFLSEGYSEEDCLKSIRALSNEPLVPAIDKVCIAVGRTSTPPPDAKYVENGVTYTTKFYGGGATTTIFSCIISREELLKGEAPEAVIRNGVFVSGPYEGQRTDSLWLREKKKNTTAKP